ncbi:MAG TPA: permease-like cell division protein FtsX [Bacteroidales bacterium]|jgi:cell division transport system permease protein|nr:cell division protein FtsX [Bacteroidales bacterium]MDI9533490.1 permease-like cell division protein FtsX [Bacteroidota bacterium]MBK7732873.1 cell division protein FtsX [Bacteroidales bacterium]MBP7036747.1 permease-like cell division protein FtsX [Bacteroidales bacterium]MBP8708972.1 permease-like cell division protein FtsX [Bacteroidales bacterium]
MAKSTGGISRYRLGSSYVTLVVSVSLVLFLLGILGMVLINARQLSDYFRESLSFTIMLKEDAREADIRMLQKELDAKPYVKLTRYVSKDVAAMNLREELGEDFLDFLGYNPLMPTIDVYLLAEYTQPDSVIKIEKVISEYPVVDEVYYQESFLNLINDNFRRISVFLLVISFLLFLIALTIINNTIRLSIYSKRFLINTMQLIGANRSFIRKPFLLRSLFFGFLAALIAIGLLMGLMYLVEKEFFTLFTYENINLFLLLCLALVVAGVIINWISTFFAVNRYLGMHEDKLYY